MSRGLLTHVARGVVWTLAVTLACAGALVGSAHAADQITVAVIDFNRVVGEVIKTTPEYRDFKIEKEKRELEFERRRQEIEKLTRELEENKHLWSEDKLRGHRDTLRDKRADARFYAESIDRFIQAEQAKITRRNLPQVRTFLEEYGTRKGYSLIIDKGNVWYYSEALSITDEVIKELTD